MLYLDIKVGESVTIGDNVTVTLEEKSGQVARLAFDADKSVPIRKAQPRDTAASIAARSGLEGAR